MRQGLAGALLIALCAAAACADTAPPPAAASDGLAHDGTLPLGGAVGDDRLRHANAGTPRATDIDETRLIAHNAALHFAAGIGFSLDRLTASAYSNDSGQPLRLGDPTSFRIVVHRGRVVMSADELAALLNRYTFAFEGAPLRRIHIRTIAGRLGFAGQYYRHGWVNFSMQGALALENAHTLKFTADTITVAGRPAAELLAAAHVKLDDLLDVSARGVVLSGNTIRLHVLEMFPPPRMQLAVRRARVRRDGVVLDVDDGVDVPDVSPAKPADSYLLVRGGDVKVMRTVVRDANLELLPALGEQRLDLSLYHYRRQLVAGHFNFRRTPHDVFIARLPALADIAGRGS